MTQLNCSFCIFFEGVRDKEVVGNCRAHPPQGLGVIPASTLDGKVRPQPLWGFPQVRGKYDWCGEFRETPGSGEHSES